MQRSASIPLYFIYREAPREVDLRFIHVETISARHRLHNWNVEPHRHVGLGQLMLWTRGHGECLREDVATPFRAPALIAMPPGAVHGFRLEPGSDALVVTISEDFLAEVIGRAEPELAPGFAAPLVLDLTADEVQAHDLDRIFRAIEREYLWSAPARVAAIAGHLKLALVALARLQMARSAPAAAVTARDAELVARFRALVEEHFRDDWPVEAYARALGLTPARLNAVCRTALGRSVLEVVHARMLTEAKRLLHYTAHGVAEIGYSLGFKDPAYFSRFFTRRAGEPPSAYRTRHARPDVG